MKHREPDVEHLAWWERFLIRITPPCTTVTRMISESFERTLTPRERIQLRLHYRICVWCLRFREQLQLLHSGLARHADRLAGAETGALPEPVRERIKARLADELAHPLPTPATAPVHPAAGAVRWLPRFALVPVVAFLLSLGSRWCIRCVEIEHIGGVAMRIAHGILSWPYLAGHALGIVTETPEGFPLCCFIGWTGAGLLAVAGWALLAHFTQSDGTQRDRA